MARGSAQRSADAQGQTEKALTNTGRILRIRGPFRGYRCAEAVEGYSSGQRGQTVNLLAYAYVGSNPTPSTILFRAVRDTGRNLAVESGWRRRE